MQATKTLRLVVLMTVWGLPGPLCSQTAPNFPSMEASLEARAPLVRRDLRARIAGLEAELSGKSWIHSLVIDRIEGVFSYGRGLTVLSQTDNGAGVVTDTLSDQSRFTWGINYSIGLKELTRDHSSQAALRRALAVAEAELEQAVMADRVAMLEKLSDYLEQRAAFEKNTSGPAQTAEASTGGVDVKAGYRMRKLALEILVLQGKDREPLFDEWFRFRPDGSRSEATTLALR